MPSSKDFLPNTIEFLIEAGGLAPSADNMQPWRFAWDGSRLSLTFRHRPHDDHLFTEHDPASLMAMGAAAENVTQAAALLGHIIRPLAPGHNAEGHVYLGAEIDVEAAATPEMRQHALFLRHTNRMSFQPRSLPLEAIAGIQQFTQEEARLQIFSNEDQRRSIAALVQSASEVRFQIRKVHEWFMATLRFSDAQVETGDGLDVRTLPLPPGGHLLLRVLRDWRRMSFFIKLGIHKNLAKIESRPIQLGPSIVAIFGPGNSAGAFAAGRLMERVWIYLNSIGVAVQPYYVVTDQIERHADSASLPPNLLPKVANLRDETFRFFKIPEGQKLYMLLRTGLPAVAPTRAKRLPLDEIS